MKYVRTITVTPLNADGNVSTLMATGYENKDWRNAISTGWHPAPMVVEVWEAEDGETAEQQKASEAAQQAEAKMQALRAEHPELFSVYDALQSEYSKQQERCSRLSSQNVIAQSKQKRGRRAKVSSVALF